MNLVAVSTFPWAWRSPGGFLFPSTELILWFVAWSACEAGLLFAALLLPLRWGVGDRIGVVVRDWLVPYVLGFTVVLMLHSIMLGD